MTGQQIVDLAMQHVGEAYLLGVFVPKSHETWQGPWDCAEFASWCVFQINKKLYGCEDDNADPDSADAFTGYWGRDADSLGTKITPEKAAVIPGAAVLRLPATQHMGHIVISDGRGGTIEAKSRQAGVTRAMLEGRRWDVGILIPGIEYDRSLEEIDLAPPTLIIRLTHPYMRGDKVYEIQTALLERGFHPGPKDGIFGPKTLAAVYAFQLSNGLVADGEVGLETAKALGIPL